MKATRLVFGIPARTDARVNGENRRSGVAWLLFDKAQTHQNPGKAI